MRSAFWIRWPCGQCPHPSKANAPLQISNSLPMASDCYSIPRISTTKEFMSGTGRGREFSRSRRARRGPSATFAFRLMARARQCVAGRSHRLMGRSNALEDRHPARAPFVDHQACFFSGQEAAGVGQPRSHRAAVGFVEPAPSGPPAGRACVGLVMSSSPMTALVLSCLAVTGR